MALMANTPLAVMGLDIGLDACAAAGIAAGNGQCCFHLSQLPLYKNKRCGHARKDMPAPLVFKAAAVFPYVGMIQIRSQVWATQPTLSLLWQTPLFTALSIPQSGRICKAWRAMQGVESPDERRAKKECHAFRHGTLFTDHMCSRLRCSLARNLSAAAMNALNSG